jgi:hypothetical protein
MAICLESESNAAALPNGAAAMQVIITNRRLMADLQFCSRDAALRSFGLYDSYWKLEPGRVFHLLLRLGLIDQMDDITSVSLGMFSFHKE